LCDESKYRIVNFLDSKSRRVDERGKTRRAEFRKKSLRGDPEEDKNGRNCQESSLDGERRQKNRQKERRNGGSDGTKKKQNSELLNRPGGSRNSPTLRKGGKKEIRRITWDTRCERGKAT